MRKMIIPALAILLIMPNAIYAVKPTDKSTDETATLMVEKLNNDTELNANQKKILKEKILQYLSKLQEAESDVNKNTVTLLREKAFGEYNAVLDSILNKDQKAICESKANQRKEATYKK